MATKYSYPRRKPIPVGLTEEERTRADLIAQGMGKDVSVAEAIRRLIMSYQLEQAEC